MAYVKKPRRKIKWKIVIPLIALLLAGSYFVITILFPRPVEQKNVKICTYDANKTSNLLDKEYDNTYSISDYFFYGETLTLLNDSYTLNVNDDLYGKTIKLHNLCNGNDILFQLSNTIDQQVELGELEEGFYEVFVVNNLQEYRMTSKNEINDNFHTITRNETTKKIELIGTNSYTENKTLKNNYVYLKVLKDQIQKEMFDVMIDPFGGNDDYGMGVDLGYKMNKLIENDEMYKAAESLKKKLEEYGLKVGITKTAMNQEINTNGENGRVAQGYDHQAKLFLNLQFNQSVYSETRGIEITHSAYSSSKLANQILHDLEKNVGLIGSKLYPGTVQDGARVGTLIRGDGNKDVYDSDISVRESGGRATGAGMMNENARENNAFATNNGKGMQGLMMKLVYISNPIDYKLWLDHQEDIISSIADSIATYYQIEKEGK